MSEKMTPRSPEATRSVSLGRRPAKVEVRQWELEVVLGPDRGKKVTTLGELLRVGSELTNDLVLTDSTVSRRHLEIERTPRGLLLRDLGSRNGTWVDGRQLLQAFLQPGEQVALGKTKLLLAQHSEGTEIELGGDSFGELWGLSQPMRAVFAQLRRLAREELSLLLEGETGTGKELAARAVHRHSPRRAGPFSVVDCHLVRPESAEREWFGLFEQAQRGTVYLDEVGELPQAVQPKLLRVLETGELRRVGDAVSRKLEVRVIASTQRNLEEEVRAGRFRADLFFRLAVARVKLPPLRTRKEDLPLLARQLLKNLGIRSQLSEQTLALFQGYDWPGNVRELRNVLERGALLEETGNPDWLDFLADPPRKGHQPGRSMPARVLGLPYHQARDRVLSDFERGYFAEVMKASGFDLKRAEQKTGMSMQSLYRLLKKNGLSLKELKHADGLD